MTRLSNTELQEKLQLIIEEIVMQGATYADSKDGLRDKNYVRAEKKAFRELLALFQAREQQLLTELLGESIWYQEGGSSPKRAVPVSVIERLQNKTNDGGRDEQRR